jgi:hypothetical protein
MPEEPADSQWRIYRARPVPMPGGGLITDPAKFLAEVDGNAPAKAPITEAETFTTNTGWRLVEGVGRGKGVMIADKPGATISFTVDVAAGGLRTQVGVLPIFPDGQAQEIAVDVSIDGGKPEVVKWARAVGSPAWAQGVLDTLLKAVAGPELSPGRHTVTVTSRTGRVALDQLRLVTPEIVPTHENH